MQRLNGLAETAKSTLNEFGILDNQVQGLGWDGEYVKKGVKKAFISKHNVECMNLRERRMSDWSVGACSSDWMNDCMKMPCFMWLTEYIKNVNTKIETLNIEKEL